MSDQPVTANLVEFYSNLDYTVNVQNSDCGTDNPCFTATHPELPGCRGQGRTEKEAVDDLIEARYDYIASMIEDGVAPPLPASSATPISARNAEISGVEVLKIIATPVTKPTVRMGNWLIDGQIAAMA